jgi:hypothetical protein
MRKLQSGAMALVGAVFLALAVYYWVTPAQALAKFMPGYQAGSAHVHYKHGLGFLIVAAGLFAFAWFRLGPRRPRPGAGSPDGA